jgi:hypothetical protein
MDFGAFLRIFFTLSFAVLTLLVFYATPASAYGVWTCNQNGGMKTTFYNNETVYVASGNITSTGGQSVRMYIVANNDSWVSGKTLVGVAGGGYSAIVTNGSGYIPVTPLWSNPVIGTYDIVVDVNNDGVYNSSYDYVNSSSAVGLTILQAPMPTLNVEKGRNNPSNHGWDLRNSTDHNPMLQLNLSATIESIKIKFVSITADGTGNDNKDISVVYLILDSDGDGQYDQGETFLDYKNYFLDNGVITFQIKDGQIVSTESSVAFLITYSMSKAGQLGSTYKFDVVSISAIGVGTDEDAKIVGLPVSSAIKTISGAASTTTTTINSTTTTIATATTTTSTFPGNECKKDEDCGGISCKDKLKTTYACTQDINRGVNICTSTIVAAACCGDADCIEGYYCLDYQCVEKAGGWISEGYMKNYIWTISSIAVVTALAVIVFIVIKNRSKRPWRSKRDYELEWETLSSKWGGKKKK